MDAPIWDDSPAGLARWILALPPSERRRCRLRLYLRGGTSTVISCVFDGTLEFAVWLRADWEPEEDSHVESVAVIDNLWRELPPRPVNVAVPVGTSLLIDVPLRRPGDRDIPRTDVSASVHLSFPPFL